MVSIVQTSVVCCAMSLLVFTTALPAAELSPDEVADADVEKANGYDSKWKADWVEHLRAIHKQSNNKTDGFVIHIGDSITYQNQNRHFAMSYKGNHEIAATMKWSLGGDDDWGGPTPPDCKNGWKLAAFDHKGGGRSYTGESGIRADQWLKGDPSKTSVTGKNDPKPLDHLLENENTGPHPDSKDGYTVAVVRDAQIACVLLGTNDVSAKRSPSAIKADLKTIYEKLIAKDIMPVAQTLPVYDGKDKEVEAVNEEIRALAKEMKLPLIDTYAESVRRVPNGQWKGKLTNDGIHPNSGPTGDPFADPTILNRSGCMLRGFLIVCKLHEIKKYVMDGQTPPGGESNSGSEEADLLRITTTDAPAGMVGSDYEFKAEADGGIEPYRWTATGLPSGLKISSEGIVSGKPKKAGKYAVVLKAKDKKFKTSQAEIEIIIDEQAAQE
ncbi:MAG: GDSL-type esterase/lipase family protein [Planctomycetota bacterium]